MTGALVQARQAELLLAALPLAAATLQQKTSHFDPAEWFAELQRQPVAKCLPRLEGHVDTAVFRYLSAPEHGLRDHFAPHVVERRLLLDAAWRVIAGFDSTGQVVWLAANIVHEATRRLSDRIAREEQAERIARGDRHQGCEWSYATLHAAEELLLGQVLPLEQAGANGQRQRLDALWAWCEHGSRDLDVLERAGLHAAEAAVLVELYALTGPA
jgi:hypothetical protein